MAWIEFIAPVLVAALVLLVPGAVLCALLGLRGFAVLAAAPPISVSIVACAAIVGPMMNQPWSLLPVAVVWLIVGAIILATRFVTRNRRTLFGPVRADAPREPTFASVGWVLGAGIIIVTICWVIGSPENFSIRWDNAFHMSAVRFALETQDASSLTIGRLTAGSGSVDFYPAAWHGLVSLVATTTGADIPVAVNAVNVAIAACAWVGGCVLLGATIARNAAIGAVAGGLVACLLHAFPLLLLDWGVLYPNFLGYALLPAYVAMAAILFRVKGVERTGPWLTPFLLLGLMAPGITLSHPSATLVAVVVATIFGSVRVWEWAIPRSLERRRPIVIALATTLVLSLVSLAAWTVARPPLSVAPWVAVQSIAQAAGELLLNAHLGRPISLLVSIAAIVGLLVLCARRQFALAIFAVFVGVLFIASTGLRDEALRELFVGPFYGDNYRLAALTAIAVLPIAVVGLEFVLTRTVTAIRVISARSKHELTVRRVLMSMGAILLVVFFVASVAVAIVPAGRVAATSYRVTETSDLVDRSELELIELLPQLVEKDAVLLGDPVTGTPFAYALTGLTVVPPYMFFKPTAADVVLRQELNRAADDPEARERVCEAVADLEGDVFVLDFRGTGDSGGYEGLRDLRSPVVEPVKTIGEASLVRVNICNADAR